MRILTFAELTDEQARCARLIFEEAFPAWERVDWKDLLRPHDAAALQVALVDDSNVLGLATLTLIGVSQQWWFLEYFAIASGQRDRGLGTTLWDRLVALTGPPTPPETSGIVFEIEPPENPDISAAERSNRLRRLRFYERRGAVRLPVPAYRIPRLREDSDEPMLLLAYSWNEQAPTREHVVDVVRALMREYGLPADHPLVVAAVASVQA